MTKQKSPKKVENIKMKKLQAFLTKNNIRLHTEAFVGHKYGWIAIAYFKLGEIIGIKVQPRIKVL